jgi:hypothetical protein
VLEGHEYSVPAGAVRPILALLVFAAAVAFLLQWRDRSRQPGLPPDATLTDTSSEASVPAVTHDEPPPPVQPPFEPSEEEAPEIEDEADEEVSRAPVPPPTDADAEPVPDPPAEPPEPAPLGTRGIWVDRAVLMSRPTRGDDWEQLLTDARRDAGRANIADQDSNHDVLTLADALVCVRLGEHCEEAREGVLAAIGTEAGARWLAVGRNLGSYVIAADLLDLREGGVHGADGAVVQRWIEGWMSKELADNNTDTRRRFAPFHSGANAAAQEGFAYAAVAAYLRDEAALRRAWDAFRTFVCDPAAPDRERIDLMRPVRDGWTHDDREPCAINPAGTEKLVPSGTAGEGRRRRIDGALVADMRRGGVFQSVPTYTQYPWVGLEGLVPAAVILERAGYPAFEVGDRAVLRSLEYLRYLREETNEPRWFDGVRAREIVHLVNAAYGTSLPVSRAIAGGRTVGYTGWTHPRR